MTSAGPEPSVPSFISDIKTLVSWLSRRLRPRLKVNASDAARHDPPELIEGVSSTGGLVDDVEVSQHYPDAVRRVVTCLPLLHAQDSGRHWSSHEITINVFSAHDIVVTAPFYIPIDTKHGWLFRNHAHRGIIGQKYHYLNISGENYTYNSGSIRQIEGPVVIIGGFFTSNYYHWVVNWLSRLAIIRLLRPDLLSDAKVRFFVDDRARSPPFIDFLLAAGVSADRIIWSDGEDVFFEQAILVSLGNRDETCPEVVGSMRELFGSIEGGAERPRRRLWISRQALGANRRRVANMEEIKPILDRHDFEDITLEGMSLAEQINLFRSAEAVMGVHGSGLTNMIFSPPGCRIIALESGLNIKFNISRFYSTLAEACELDYVSFKVRRARLPPGAIRNFENTHNQDYIVDPGNLDRLLRGFLPPLYA